MKICILDWHTITANDDISYDVFEKIGEVRVYTLSNKSCENDVITAIGDSEIVLTNKVVINSLVMDKCKNIKYIGVFATGYNNIDVDYAKIKNILVCNAGSYSTGAVAQHTFAFILNFYNKVCLYNEEVKNNKWINSNTFAYFPHPINELSGKTIAIIGYGSIGKKVAEIASVFGMEIIINTRTRPENCPYKIVELKEAFEQADILTIHCPLTEQNQGLICDKNLAYMKNSAYIINTSRGAIVNEEDLYAFLKENKIAGAALDVLVEEPMSKYCKLKELDNCTITPHVAWAAVEARNRLVNIVAENIKSYLAGAPKNKVN